MADQRYHYKAGYGPTECGIDFDTDNYKSTTDVAEVTCRECLEGIFHTITANPKLRRRFVIATINPQVY